MRFHTLLYPLLSLTTLMCAQEINQTEIETQITQAMSELHVPGVAIGIIVDGKVELCKCFGYKDLEKQLNVTPDTQFAIGSGSKPFATFVLSRLAEEGKLHWDDRVIKHYPEMRLDNEYTTSHMTIKDVASHQSGMPRHDGSWYNMDYTSHEIVSKLPHLPSKGELRSEFIYNNIMYTALGCLTEKVTGKSWPASVDEYVFKPLKMTHSNFSIDEMQKSSDHAKPYFLWGETNIEIPFRNVTSIGPAGAINSTLSDMIQWLKAQMGLVPSLISTSSLQEMHRPHVPCSVLLSSYPTSNDLLMESYGLGWFTQVYRGHYNVFHAGNVDGFSSLVSMLPLDKIGVVVMCNQNASPLPYLVASSIFDTLLGIEKKELTAYAKMIDARNMLVDADAEKKLCQVADTSPSHKVEEFVGTYSHPGYGLVEIDSVAGRLVATFNRFALPLDHWHYDVFKVSNQATESAFHGVKVAFGTSTGGAIESISVPLEPMLADIVFKRMANQKLKDPKFLQCFVGKYLIENSPIEVGVELKGDLLSVQLPGMSPYALLPEGESGFTIAELPGVKVQYHEDEKQMVDEIMIVQPNGTFKALKQP